MNDLPEPRQDVPAGLCASCRHASAVPSDRGVSYIRCECSRTDDRFPRYPRLPMQACAGYAAKAGEKVG
jgi:hypothetical protein